MPGSGRRQTGGLPRWWLALCLVCLGAWGSAPAGAQDAPPSVDLNFARLDLVVWGNGTAFTEFQVDAAPGDRIDVGARVQLSRNRLEAPAEATFSLRLEGASIEPLGANTSFAIGPEASSGRFVEVGPLNVSVPLDAEFGTYTLVVRVDAPGLESHPLSNEKRVPVLVGPRAAGLEGAVGPAHFVALFIVVGVAIGAAVFARRYQGPRVVAARRRIEAFWDRAREAWVWHPRRRARRLALTGALVFLLIVALAWAGFFEWPSRRAFAGRLVTGLLVGAVYALVALGYTMVYGVLKFINFAHGEVFMWGAYAALYIAIDLERPFWAAVIGAVLFAAVLGALIERVAYRPLRGKPRLTPLITAIGVSLFLSAAAQFFFTARTYSYRPALERTIVGDSTLAAWLGHEVLVVWGVPVQALGLVILVSSVVLMLLLHLFIRYSRLGKAMRAVADDIDTAAIIGIRVDRVITTTFVIGSALAAVAGVLYGMRLALSPTMGFMPGIKAFTAAVVGGIGNVYGAFFGGFLIGLAESVGGAFLVQTGFQEAIAFLILVVVLIVRPTGLFGAAKGAEVRRK